MRLSRIAVFMLVLAAVLLQACGGLSTADAIATGVAQTLQISRLETAAAGGSDQAATPPSSSGDPAAQATATPQPTSLPYVSVSVDTHCRSGPSIQYPRVTTLLIGQEAEVLKVFDTADYVIVRNPVGAGDCWLWLRYASPTDFAQYDLPVATLPPTPAPTLTPTPVYDWGGSWSNKATDGVFTYNGSIEFHIAGNTVNGTTMWAGLVYTFTGTLSASKQEVTGTYTVLGDTRNWRAMIKPDNPNQFIGNLHNGDWAFCGWRGGAGEPNPCMWP